MSAGPRAALAAVLKPFAGLAALTDRAGARKVGELNRSAT